MRDASTDLEQNEDSSHPGDLQVSPARAFAGGVLMGLANLVPGVSGGTMILALGLYDRFIGAVAELTRLRPSRRTLVFLAIVGAGLAIAVLGMATPAVWLVTQHRWAAYSLFIGMTLGGVPALWPLVRPLDARSAAAIAAGFAGMAWIAFGLSDAPLPHNFAVLAAAGAAAASSMILPGISGSYILLIFGLYDVVIGSVRPRALLDDTAASLAIVVPTGIGVVLGIALLSNLLKALLQRFERPTHGVLLGLLLGSVLGLWPFQRAVHPLLTTDEGLAAAELLAEGATDEELAAASELELAPEETADLRARYADLSRGDLKLLALELTRYPPAIGRIALSLALLAAGFTVTRLLGTRGGST